MQELVNKTKKILLSGTVVVTVGILIGAFFSYLLQLFLARRFSVDDYGTFTALLSIANLIGIIPSILTVAMIKVSAELLAKENLEKLTLLFWKSSYFSFATSIVIFLIFFLLKDKLGSELNIKDTTLFIYFGALSGLSFLLIAPQACLQGLLRFKAYSFFISVGGILRFLFPVIAVLIGYRLRGVLFGLSAGVIVAFILSILLLKKNFRNIQGVDLKEDYKRILKFSIPAFFVNFSMLALTNIDMVLVKKYFDSDIAGYYAGVVTLGKILLFGVGSVVTVMFPVVAASYTKGKNYMEEFLKLLFVQILFIIGGVGLFYLFPKFVTLAFFGLHFSNSINYLPLFSIFMGIYVLVNFLLRFFIAIEKEKIFWVLFPAILVQYFLITIFHSNLYQIIYINIFISSLLLLLLLIYLGGMFLSRPKIKDIS